MRKVLLLALMALVILPAVASAATGTDAAGDTAGSYVFPPGRATMALGICVGLGLIIIGAGKGIGAIGSHATDSIARQPEAAPRIFTTMIISAALIEGVTLFAIVVALLTMLLGDVR